MSKPRFLLSLAVIVSLITVIIGCGAKTANPAANATTATPAANTAGAKQEATKPPANASSGDKFTIKINSDVAANTVKGQSWRHFESVLKTKLGDRVNIEIYDSGSLYNQSEQLQALQQNNIQFMAPVPGVLAGQFPKLQVFGLPYLFKSPSMISEAINDPNIGAKLFADVEQKNVKITNVWLNGWRMVASRKPITKMEDLKGIKIRVPAGNNYVDTFKAMGANVVTINWSEVPSSLQQGVIDAVEPTPNANVSDKLYEIAPNVTNSDHILDLYVITTNKKWFDGLPADVKKAVQEALDDTAKWNWDATTKANDDAMKTMKDHGTNIIKMNDEELARWENSSQKVIDSFNPIVGADIIQSIREMAKKYKWERQ